MEEMIKVNINGEEKEVEKGRKVIDIIDKKYFACRVNGELKDLSYVLKDGDKIELLNFDSREGKEIFWHSSAHLLAHAVKRLFPKARLAIGPSIEEGFYYDFDVPTPFTPEDIKKIEKEMQKISKENLKIEKKIYPKRKAVEFYKWEGERYKLEILQEIEDEKVGFYKQGDFIDLCKGPHLPSTGYIKFFKLTSVAGAYWKGDEKNPMLQRIYGISFPDEKRLEEYLKLREEAKRRDHRVLGKKLKLFEIFEDTGPGLVFWYPKGSIVRKEIEKFWIEEHEKRGYLIVYTPHIAKSKLWHLSGHYEYYKENMFIFDIEDTGYVIKPMNCPGHIMIYKSEKRSYRDLPIKLAELGTVYRNERSGVLHGMLRVRGFTIDDAHIFCTPEQIEEEVSQVIDLAMYTMRTFGYEKFKVELSLRDESQKEKYAGEDEDWIRAQEILERLLIKKSMEFRKMPGEAAFYGPKIDIKLVDALGRPWQGPTIQLDFALPKRFNLTYMGKDGKEHLVVMIHRAILGSMERFFGGLIEHYGGFFPTWLSPYQVVVMNVTDDVLDYATDVAAKLIEEKIRVVTYFDNEKISYKIKMAEEEKIPYMIIVGRKEKENNTLSVRKKGKGEVGEKTLETFIYEIKEEIKQRR